MTFGLWEECPDDAPIAWGARMVFEEALLRTLPSRTTRRGEFPAMAGFLQHMREGLRVASRYLFDLKSKGELKDDETITALEEPGLALKIKKAGDYYHVIAYQPKTKEDAKWAGEGPLPKRLQSITVRMALGEKVHAIVLSYFEDNGYLGLVVRPLDPPAWFLDQREPRWTTTLAVFGPEVFPN